MTEDFIILNGDMLFTASVVAHLCAAAPAEVRVTISQKPAYDEDDMKVSLESGRLTGVGKRLAGEDVQGESIGMILFRGQGPARFRKAVRQAMADPYASRQRYYLSVINDLARLQPLDVCVVSPSAWCEVDVPADLEAARRSLGQWRRGVEEMVGWPGRRAESPGLEDADAGAVLPERRQSVRPHRARRFRGDVPVFAEVAKLTQKEAALVTEEDGTPLAAVTPVARRAEALRWLGGDATPPADWPVLKLGELGWSYNRTLRKSQPLCGCVVRAENRAAVEERIYRSTYKGVTHLVTKYLWPRPALFLTRWFLRAGLSPNLVTLLGLGFMLAALWLFAEGAFGLGLLAAWIMALLDTVDGKMARVRRKPPPRCCTPCVPGWGTCGNCPASAPCCSMVRGCGRPRRVRGAWCMTSTFWLPPIAPGERPPPEHEVGRSRAIRAACQHRAEPQGGGSPRPSGSAWVPRVATPHDSGPTKSCGVESLADKSNLGPG